MKTNLVNPDNLRPIKKNELEEIEIQLLLEGIYRHYGYDFRDYEMEYIKRRILDKMHVEKAETISALQDKVLHDPPCFTQFLISLSTQVTAMFRDPSFYQVFRHQVIPLLRNLPFIRIWHAGCSTGEEVYSMAILLMEAGLYDQCRIYATDMNEIVLESAKTGIFPLKSMREYTKNYLEAGGEHDFSRYYTAQYENAVFQQDLRANIIFAQHNLVSDASFNEFHVILCRNVMIYFNKPLQVRVLNLLYESLHLNGILGLGRGETIQFTTQESFYRALNGESHLYEKIQ